MLHALKSLVRDHPRAALSAAGAGIGYAVTSVAEDAKEGIANAAARVKTAVVGDETEEPPDRQPPQRRKPD